MRSAYFPVEEIGEGLPNDDTTLRQPQHDRLDWEATAKLLFNRIGQDQRLAASGDGRHILIENGTEVACAGRSEWICHVVEKRFAATWS